MKRFLKILSVFFIYTIFLIGCAMNPVTGKKELMLISQSQEIQLGKNTDTGLRMQYGIYNDRRLNAYIAQLGQRMVPHTHRPQLKYHFAVLDMAVPNAFAAPGGYIYVTRGILAMINSEAELNTIIGHELGHVNARHTASRLSKAMLLNLGMGIASQVSKDFKKIAPYAQIATQLLFLKYSRTDEYEADSLGINYTRKVGYSPSSMINFFQSLQHLKTRMGGSSVPNFLSTHPLTERRIQKVREQVKPGDARLRTNRNNFMAKINGLVYGKDPRQGYVMNNAFYHPVMRFWFQIPSKWHVQNTPQMVLLSSPNKNAVIILKAEKSQINVQNYIANQMSSLSNITILSRGFRKINYLNAYHTIFNTTTQTNDKQTTQNTVWLSSIRKGNWIYSFYSLTPASAFSSWQNQFARTIGSFRALTDPKHLNRRPLRIYIRRITRNQTLRNFLVSQRIPQKIWSEISFLNGLGLDQKLSPNRPIKTLGY